jgi:thiamine phosphate phosphatase / amino-HMP aminohydrolase
LACPFIEKLLRSSRFVEKIKEIGGQWGIVSVNFSEEWIRGVLGNHLRDVEILANQPDETGQLKGPKDENGNRGELIVTSDGKLAAIKVMLRRLQMEPGTSRVVYVGDSGTDFECLLEGGVIGIVMVEEDGTSKLLDTFKRVSSDPEYMFLENFQEIKEYDEGRGKALYFARDFQEIVESNLFE